MRVEGSYPAPVRGVSKLEKSNRPAGYAEEQINMRADMMSSLIRRPSMRWAGTELAYPDLPAVATHSYSWAGDIYTIRILRASSTTVIVQGFKNGEFVGNTTSTDLNDYLALPSPSSIQEEKIRLRTVTGITYIINTLLNTQKIGGTDLEEPYRRAAHINVLTALNYAETITLTVRDQSGSTWTVTHTVPDLGDPPDYDAADKERATAKVAAELASKIFTATPSNILAAAKGSTVAIWTTPNTEWVDVEVVSGQGDRSLLAINQTVESAEGLPLYAIVGTVIQVKPNPTQGEGSYWLQAVRTGSSTAPPTAWLTTVAWVETVNPELAHGVDPKYMPHRIQFNPASIQVNTIGWERRRVGDDTSNKDPDFLGKPIQDMALIQDRLAILTARGISLSKTGEHYNFYKDSAVRLLVTDRVDVASSLAGVDALRDIVAHNGSLLIFAENAQLKLDGNTAITPQTASLAVMTRYRCQLTTPPVSTGNRVVFPISYGKSSGLMSYTAESNTNQDTANSITDHIKGYIPGDIRLLTASTEMGIIVVGSTEGDQNVLYVADFGNPIDSEGIVHAWSKWTLPEDMIPGHVHFDEKDMVITSRSTIGERKIAKIALQQDPDKLEDKVYLDWMIELTSTDGINFPWPPADSVNVSEYGVAIRGQRCEYPLQHVEVTQASGPARLVADEDLRAAGEDTCTIYVGQPYTSSYTPTLPFLKDSSGRNSGDRVRVSRLNLDLENTVEMQIEVNSEYYETPLVYEFESDLLADPYSLLGQVNLYTGREAFPVGISNEQGTVTFSTDSHHGMTIAGISWLGQHHRPSRRL